MAKRRINHYTQNEIDNWFQWNLNLRDRTMYLGSITIDSEGKDIGIDTFVAEYAIKGLQLLSDSKRKIRILINTEGGNWYHGMAIYDAIRSCKSPVDIEAYGNIMSMGVVILQAGDRRLLHPNATLMIHDGTVATRTTEISPESARRWSDYEGKLRIAMYNIFQERTGKYPSIWKRICSHDRPYTAEEAVEFGLADAVIPPKKQFIKVKRKR